MVRFGGESRPSHPAGWRPAARTAGPAVGGPYFLVGAERSGSTLLRLMLDGHPDLAWAGEFDFAFDPVPAAGGLPDPRSFRRFLSDDRVFRRSGLHLPDGLDYPGLVNDFLDQKRGTKPLVGATVHRHFDRLLRVWPAARFVHLVRDPRDVARSVIEMGWAGNPWTAGGRWVEAERQWGQVSAGLPADRHLTLRYEDLVRGPERELGRVCEFCGVDYHPAMLAYPASTTYGPPVPASAGRWRRDMPARDVRLAEARVGDLLSARGYEPSGLPPLRVGPALAWRLRRQDHLARVRFRAGRYGWGLFLADFLTRRLGLAAWQARVRRRLDDVDAAFLR